MKKGTQLILQRLKRPLRFWEVGVNFADTSTYLLERLPWLQIDAVDTYVEQSNWVRLNGAWSATAQGQWVTYSTAAARLRAFGNRARIWRMESVAAARSLVEARKGADVVFIDAAHTYCTVLCDLEAWAPFVEKFCGVIVGHDWSWGFGFPDGPVVSMAAITWHVYWSKRRFMPPISVAMGGLWWVDLSIGCGT